MPVVQPGTSDAAYTATAHGTQQFGCIYAMYTVLPHYSFSGQIGAILVMTRRRQVLVTLKTYVHGLSATATVVGGRSQRL